MTDTDTPAPSPDAPDTDDEPIPPTIQAHLERLREENTRLRDEYARARQTSYRKTALGLGTTGLLALLGAVLLPGSRDILLVLGAIGVFSGLLTRYLTPERVVTIDVSESIHAAHSDTITHLIDELGLQKTPIYLPIRNNIRLFIPKHPDASLPTTLDDTGSPTAATATDSDALFVTPSDTRGITLAPSARELIADLNTTHPQESDALIDTIELTGDALVEQFEIADNVTVREASTEPPERVVISVTNPAFGPLDTIDHPIVSALATNAATHLDTPISTDVTTNDNEQLIVCRRHTAAPSSD